MPTSLAKQTPVEQIVFLHMRYRIKQSALGLRLASSRRPALFAERARVGDVDSYHVAPKFRAVAVRPSYLRPFHKTWFSVDAHP